MSLRREADPMIPAIVLAAGRSSRMGTPKAALPLPGGQTFLSHLLASLVAGGTSSLVVVTGRDVQPTRDAAGAGARGVVFVPNPQPDRGQLSSLQHGVEALPSGTEAALVTLVDVPIVRPSTVLALMSRWRVDGPALVRLERQGRHGHPYLAGRAVLDAILAAPETLTARDVLAPWLPGVDLPIDDPGPFEDVDTPEEYQRLLERLSRSASRDA